MTNKNKLLIAIGSLLATASTIFFIKKSQKTKYEKPPKGAPQLDIENPGSQDEFPRAPMESDLG